MTVSTVRPNGTPSGGGSFTVTGAATAHAALSDNSDTSYIRKSATGTASIILGNGTITLTSDQAVRQVRVRGRVEATETDSKGNLYLGVRTDGVNYFTSAVPIRGVTAKGEVAGPWYAVAPDGGAWTQEKINEVRTQFTDYRDAAQRVYVYETYVDVDVATRPTTTVTAPTGSVTTTSRPEISWTYADTESEAQTYYRAAVFDDATYTSGAFDPETSAGEWDSGVITSEDTSTTVGALLVDGTYRVYVKTAKTLNGSPFWSEWAFSGFTVSLTPPPTPTVAATYASGGVVVTVTGGAPTGFASQTFEVQRSVDGGVTWAAVRDGDALTPSGAYIATVTDYEAPRGVTARYRARAVGVDGSDEVASDWSTDATVSVPNDGAWWLKVIGASALNVSAARVTDGVSEEQGGQVAVFQPIGRARSVVVEGALGGRDGSYRIFTSSDAEFSAVYAAVTSQRTLLVQDPFGQQKYVRVTDRSWELTGTPARPIRVVEVSYVEVDGP